MIAKSPNTEAFTQTVISWPVKTSFIGSNWQEQGIAQVLVARELPQKTFMIGMYLVDLWCLGVKDATMEINIEGRELLSLEHTISIAGEGLQILSYEDARSIVFGALKYAANHGFSPHHDWDLAKHVIEPNRSFEDKFEFGRNGKPFYAAGPYDKPVYKEYVKKVKAAGGRWSTPKNDEW